MPKKKSEPKNKPSGSLLSPVEVERQRFRLEKAVQELKDHYPWWGFQAEKLTYVMRRGWNTTCAVDGGRHFFWNPEFLSKLSDKHINFVVVHELYHIMFRHIWRGEVYIEAIPEGVDFSKPGVTKARIRAKNAKRWNCSADLAIHASLVPQIEFRYSDWMEFWQEGLYDPAFAGCAAETINQFLLDNNDQHSSMDGRGPGAMICIGKGPAPEGAKELADGQYIVVYDEDGNPVDVSDDPILEGMSESEVQDMLNEARRQANEYEAKSKKYGSEQGNTQRTVTITQVPQRVDWRRLLLRFMTNSAKADYSWTRPSRRAHHLGVVLPGLDSHQITGVIAVDTSGSIDDALLEVFGQEIQNIRSQVPFHELTILYCDTRIQKTEVVTQGQSLEFNPKGGGGTDFRPVFEQIENFRISPNFLIYFTDLEGRFPTHTPVCPTLWGVYNNLSKAPFGETIHLK